MKGQLAPPRESSTEEDAETRSQPNPDRVVRESEKNGADASAKDQTHSSGDGRSGLRVLSINHAPTLQAKWVGHATAFSIQKRITAARPYRHICATWMTMVVSRD
jgi:hypothetical protein